MLDTENNTIISHSFNLMTPLYHHFEFIPWSDVKNYLSECWLQFYGPFFWIIHLFLCHLELNTKQHPSIDLRCTTITQSIIFENQESNPLLHPLSTIATPIKENNDHIINTNQTDIDEDNASSSSSSSSSSVTRSPKSFFKQSLRGHLKAIKQKAMKRSLLRKSSKQSLMSIQQVEDEEITSSPSSISPTNTSTISLPTTLYNNNNDVEEEEEEEEEKGNSTSLTISKQPVFTSLDRRPSLSDSLLKSFSKKKKQPSLPFPMTLQSNHNYSKATLLSSSTIPLGRRKTCPTIYTKVNS